MTNQLIELKHKGNKAIAGRRYDEAHEAFQSAIELYPEEADGYVGLARVLERTHRHEEVVALLTPVVHRFGSVSLLKVLGNSHRVLANRGQKEHVDAAIECYEDYLVKRKDAVILYYLGELYREHKGDFKKAYGLLLESWEKDPGSRTVYNAAMACAKRLGLVHEVNRLKELWKASGRN